MIFLNPIQNRSLYSISTRVGSKPRKWLRNAPCDYFGVFKSPSSSPGLSDKPLLSLDGVRPGHIKLFGNVNYWMGLLSLWFTRRAFSSKTTIWEFIDRLSSLASPFMRSSNPLGILTPQTMSSSFVSAIFLGLLIRSEYTTNYSLIQELSSAFKNPLTVVYNMRII